MDNQQFTLIIDKFNGIKDDIKNIKDDVKDIRNEQKDQGKSLAKVCTKIKAHSWIHRTTGAGVFGLFIFWLRSKLI